MSRIKFFALLVVLVIAAGFGVVAYVRTMSPLSALTDDEPWPTIKQPNPSDDPRMPGLAEFAGYCAADGIMRMPSDGTFTQWMAWETPDGARILDTNEGENRLTGSAVWTRMDENPDGNARGLVVTNLGLIRRGAHYSALAIDVRQYGGEELRVVFVVPYRTEAEGGFGVFPPILGDLGNFLYWDPNRESGPGIDAFLRGIKSHEKGYAVWEAKKLE